MSSFTQGPGLSITATANQQFTLTLPARAAGDWLQFVVYAPNGLVPPPNFDKVLDLGGLLLFVKKAEQSSAAGGTFTLQVTGAGIVRAVAQAVSSVDPSEPSLPTLLAVLVEGDSELTVNWDPSDPAAFASYVAKITAPSSAVQSSGTLPASARSRKFTGLTNGVEHTIVVEGTTN